MEAPRTRCLLHILGLVLGLICLLSAAAGLLLDYPVAAHKGRRVYEFNITYASFTRLCSTKSIPTVNGLFPGPTLTATEGDNVLVKVSNQLPPGRNVTIHWHGIRQLRNGWADGPGYITQCPMKSGTSYTYNFKIIGQRGTLWWHAHLAWMRATIYGALVILPKQGTPYPFPKPHKEVTLILGEWWKASVEVIINQAMQSGGAPNSSDAYTINGQPGDLYPCSAAGTTVVEVECGRTYMLRIINAAMNGEMFLSVGGHKLTVVEVDAVYTKPVDMDTVLITPGQTMNVLLKADAHDPAGRFYLAARPYIAPNVTLDNTTTTAVIAYTHDPSNTAAAAAAPVLPSLPAITDTSAAAAFSTSIRSLNSPSFPAAVPLRVDRHLFFTVGLAASPCAQCARGARLVGVVNNISFALPQTALLQAHYFRQSAGVFSADFPDQPPSAFNFTQNPQPNTTNVMAPSATRLSHIRFNSNVQLVLQGTSLIGPENHPIHLHGFNFFVVGQGFGNYNASADPASFNLVDPQERNTIGVPQGGWVALRFKADNPGVWFMHCHLELHNAIGLDMAFVVDNGPKKEDSIMPPPHDLPPC